MEIYILTFKTGIAVLTVSLLGAGALYGALLLIKNLIVSLIRKKTNQRIKKVNRLKLGAKRPKQDINFEKLKNDLEHWQQIIES